MRLGGWLFRQRTWLPLPIVVLLLTLRPRSSSRAVAAGGVLLVAAAELVRLWAVRYIGTVSRTRSDRLGPLIGSGPFGLARNPLYVANILLWVGFALSARLPWLAAVVGLALALEYHAIVRWEEQLLDARRGAEYRAYARRVPRWIPVRLPRGAAEHRPAFSWRETFFSERGTLLAILVGYLLLWIKEQLL